MNILKSICYCCEMQIVEPSQKPTVLFCTPFLNFPPTGGPELRTMNTIKALSKISNISVARIVKFGDESDVSLQHSLKSLGVSSYMEIKMPRHQLVGTSKSTGLNLFVSRLINICFRVISFQLYRARKHLAEEISKINREEKYDALWMSFGNLYIGSISRLKRLESNLPVVTDTDSVWSDFILRSARYKPIPQRIISLLQGVHKRFEERRMLSISLVVTAVSEVDQLRYQSMTSHPKKVFCAYNVIDLSSYEEASRDLSLTKSKIILLAGSFGHKYSPMDHGAKWFIDNVWPIIKMTEPEAILHIVGKGSDVLWRTRPENGVFVFGRVESINPFMKDASVSVVPLWFESGTRFKILESAAMSTPVVTTSLGVEGLLITDCADIAIADTPEDFANSVLKFILHKTAPNEGPRIFEVINRNYSLKYLEFQCSKILDSLKH